MRIVSGDGGGLGHVAILDEVDVRILSRSLEALPAWMGAIPEASRGRLRRLPGDALAVEAAFPDEAGLHAFLGRFLPGKLKGSSAVPPGR